MRIFLIFTCLVCASASGYSQIFRYADLAVEFTSPKLNTVVTSPSVISFTFQVVNNGPDTIFTTDTIVYGPSHSFSGKTRRRKQAFKEIVAPGDSTYFSDTISINSKAHMKPFYLAFSEVPMSYGPDNGKLFLQNEFSEDREDNKSQVKLYHTGNLSIATISPSKINVYPNPSYNGLITIACSKQVVSLQIVNHMGQQVESAMVRVSNNSFSVDMLDNPAGAYFIRIEEEDGYHTKRLIKL